MEYPINDRAYLTRGPACGPVQNRALAALLLAVISGALFGAEDTTEQEDTGPTIEILEFLGQFQTDAGEWIAPGTLLSDELSELLDIIESTTNPEDDAASDNP